MLRCLATLNFLVVAEKFARETNTTSFFEIIVTIAIEAF